MGPHNRAASRNRPRARLRRARSVIRINLFADHSFERIPGPLAGTSPSDAPRHRGISGGRALSVFSRRHAAVFGVGVRDDLDGVGRRARRGDAQVVDARQSAPSLGGAAAVDKVRTASLVGRGHRRVELALASDSSAAIQRGRHGLRRVRRRDLRADALLDRQRDPSSRPGIRLLARVGNRAAGVLRPELSEEIAGDIDSE
jgi:hypothetical protein